MATASIPVYVLGNNSHQPVSINYQVGDAAAVGDVAQTAHGLLTISPGKKVVIEQSRVNYGQLHNLASQNLLTVAQSYAS
ncbi:MAG: hypothetical protein WC919_06855 [Candidatus Paceibacterota bacterium]|jgi:hypothetical protein